ncbi:hypothetical protein [Mycobacterium sp. GA-1841]|uniref:hypothetical protein n=1 Tax=Mycobacterium sp. GA-1841 TaxID=1834154 RepID=UPI0011154CFA|nr:hypothetical protein [Mycobacterium sp. GA-1841]
MSGPKVIDYRAIERSRVEAATRRWRSLTGRASALERRCRAAGHLDCMIASGTLVAGNSDAMLRQCDELEEKLARSVNELERRRLDARTHQVMAGMQDILVEMQQREQRAAAAASVPHEPVVPLRVDYADKISARLASLRVDAPELVDAARDVLAATEPARARLLYADLVDRIEEANRRAKRAEAQRTEVAELRAQLSHLPDPDPVQALLDQAATTVDRNVDSEGLLARARAAITWQLDRVAAQSDREFVRQAMEDSLRELGYDVLDVNVETPGTLVVRQSGTHGLRADIRDGEISLRAVRLATSDAAADRDAEDEFCRRVPGLISGMSRRGLTSSVKEQKLPGLYTPETISLPGSSIRPAPRQDAVQPTVHKRNAR